MTVRMPNDRVGTMFGIRTDGMLPADKGQPRGIWEKLPLTHERIDHDHPCAAEHLGYQ